MRKINDDMSISPIMIDPIMIDPIVEPKQPVLTITQRDDGSFASKDEWGTTTIYSDESGAEILGYETSYGWGISSYFSTYNANWEIQTSHTVEGSRTTDYAMVDGVWSLVSMTVDYAAMKSTVDGDYTCYSEQDGYGNTITYYKLTASDTLDHYTVVYQNSYSYNDWWTGEVVESNSSGSTIYDANGNITSSKSEYQYGNYKSTDSTVYVYDESGKATSITTSYTWGDDKSSSDSVTVYDGNWQTLTATSHTVTSYIDDAGVEQVSEVTTDTVYEYGDSGALLGYQVTTTSDKGTETEHFDASDMYPMYPIYKTVGVNGMIEDSVTPVPTLSPDMGMPSLTGAEDAIVTTLNDSKGKSHKVYVANDDDNLISGTTGGDNLFGRSGNDTYHIDHKKDKVYETMSLTDTDDTGGEDTVEATVSYKLGNFLEHINLMGAKNINATGNELDNHIKGNTAKNQLNGGSGNDWLYGGLGKDKLIGGEGEDNFVFNTKLGKSNVDMITDFSVTDDTIVLDQSIFTALSDSTLTDSALLVSSKATKAHTQDQHLIYNTHSGALFYDVDGKGGEAAVKVAIIGVSDPSLLSIDNFTLTSA